MAILVTVLIAILVLFVFLIYKVLNTPIYYVEDEIKEKKDGVVSESEETSSFLYIETVTTPDELITTPEILNNTEPLETIPDFMETTEQEIKEQIITSIPEPETKKSEETEVITMPGWQDLDENGDKFPSYNPSTENAYTTFADETLIIPIE